MANRGLGQVQTLGHPRTYEVLRVTEQLEAKKVVCWNEFVLKPGCRVTQSDGSEVLTVENETPVKRANPLDEMDRYEAAAVATPKKAAGGGGSGGNFVHAINAIAVDFKPNTMVNAQGEIRFCIPDNTNATLIFPCDRVPKECRVYYSPESGPLLQGQASFVQEVYKVNNADYSVNKVNMNLSRNTPFATDPGHQMVPVSIGGKQATSSDTHNYLRVSIRTENHGCMVSGVYFEY